MIPTVSGVDPTLNLRTKAIFEITAAQTQAAAVAAPSEYPALFGAAPAGAAAGAAASAAAAPGATAAAASASSSSAPPTAIPMPRLDDPAAADQLSHSLEAALDTYNAHCVNALSRCQAMAKQWSASSVSTFVSSVMASSATAGAGAAPAAGAGATAGGVANSNSVAAAQTAAKRKQRERDTRVDLADLLRVELQGRRLK